MDEYTPNIKHNAANEKRRSLIDEMKTILTNT